MTNMKLDQLCFYCEEHWQVKTIMNVFGLPEADWIKDEVTMVTRLYPNNDWQASTALLMFNESLGMQLEIMRVLSGPCWILADNFNLNQIFISHIGLHLAENEPWPDMPGLLQESVTQQHTADAFHDPASSQYKRRYHYRIHRLPHSRLYLKLIRRLHHGNH